MNYLKHYKQLIRKAQHRNLNNTYYEAHHIIPECIMKLKKRPKKIYNGSWNFVNLTPREHFIAHLLLWKFSKQKYSVNHTYSKKLIIFLGFDTSTKYEKSKLEVSKSLSGLGNPRYGYKYSQNEKNKHSAVMKDYYLNNPDKMPIGKKNGMFGKKQSAYSKQLLSINSPKNKKCVCDGIMFNSMSSAAKNYNITVKGIEFRLKSKNYPEWKYI